MKCPAIRLKFTIMGNARALEYGLLGCLALLWGSSYLFIAIAVESIPPLTLIAGRVTIAALFLGSILWLRRQSLPRDPGTWGRLGLQSFLNGIGAWTVLAWGQQFVDSGLASVLNSTAPIFVVLILAAAGGEGARRIGKLVGAGMGLFGVILIVGPEALGGLGQDLLAQGAVLLGAMMYAGAALYGRNFSHLPALVTATGTMIWATVVLVPASLIVDRPWNLAFEAGALAAMGVLGLVCTGIAMILYFRLVRTLGSAGVSSQAFLRAGVGMLLGVMILSEQPEPLAWAGVASVIAGVVAINRPVSRRDDQQPPSRRPSRASSG